MALNVVTGALGFSGRHIAERLRNSGEAVRTLTNHPRDGAPFEVAPFDFEKPGELARNMEGADVLYNTYWVRFAHGKVSHEKAVQNTKLLLNAARDAGVRRVVHVSITNPSRHSPLRYFKGKAVVEDEIRSSSLSYASLRPAVIFGEEDILINNIAWLLRRFPWLQFLGRANTGYNQFLLRTWLHSRLRLDTVRPTW